MLRITVAELRRRMDIGAEFNLLKLHTASPKVSFLAYPDFETHPHPALAEVVIVDLVTGKIRRDDYRARANHRSFIARRRSFHRSIRFTRNSPNSPTRRKPPTYWATPLASGSA